MSRFKVVLVGDMGVGKTAYSERIRKGEFSTKYEATLGVDVNPLCLNTLSGNSGAPHEETASIVNIWDVAGNEKYKGLGEGYFIGAQAAIVMFDVSSQTSLDSVPQWVRKLRAVSPNIPIVICGSKVDLAQHMQHLHPAKIDRVINRLQLPYMNVSAKSNINLYMPLLALMQQLLQNNNIKVVESAPVRPPEVNISQEQAAAWAANVDVSNANEINEYVDANGTEANKQKYQEMEEDEQEEEQKAKEQVEMEDAWNQITRLSAVAAPPPHALAECNESEREIAHKPLMNETVPSALNTVSATRAMARVTNIVNHLAGTKTQPVSCSASVS